LWSLVQHFRKIWAGRPLLLVSAEVNKEYELPASFRISKFAGLELTLVSRRDDGSYVLLSVWLDREKFATFQARFAKATGLEGVTWDVRHVTEGHGRKSLAGLATTHCPAIGGAIAGVAALIIHFQTITGAVWGSLSAPNARLEFLSETPVRAVLNDRVNIEIDCHNGGDREVAVTVGPRSCDPAGALRFHDNNVRRLPNIAVGGSESLKLSFTGEKLGLCKIRLSGDQVSGWLIGWFLGKSALNVVEIPVDVLADIDKAPRLKVTPLNLRVASVEVSARHGRRGNLSLIYEATLSPADDVSFFQVDGGVLMSLSTNGGTSIARWSSERTEDAPKWCEVNY
jgi:hypothetical protein